jgi:hypothetical protein
VAVFICNDDLIVDILRLPGKGPVDGNIETFSFTYKKRVRICNYDDRLSPIELEAVSSEYRKKQLGPRNEATASLPSTAATASSCCDSKNLSTTFLTLVAGCTQASDITRLPTCGESALLWSIISPFIDI